MRFISFITLSMLANASFAANGHFYAGVDAAASSPKLSLAYPVIAYTSGVLITDAYPIDDQSNTASVIGLHAGYEYTGHDKKPAIALGLGVYTTPGNYQFNGRVIETAVGDDPTHLYDYTFSIKSTRLMAEAQFTWDRFQYLNPLLTIGAGPVWNQMNDYAETVASPNGFVALPPFQNRTQFNFAYQLGIGLCSEFNNKHERIAVAYRYVNLGTTAFGARAAVYPFQLNTGTLSTNEVYVAYTHIM